ncbi:glutamate--tRNA ligase [Stratiformator vulcanicus]|uniref:Glutamate--tRNA ligase n=1 Tax=Stratiformator vulcanicus TaxID=2527980 RepID=A0A517R6R8_9PLAN|nr:glutamate--tRNA ligase [Stratiformator vulcanicus]QDT39596.1 Glutamate--tRNA ligase 1 [Stratiformator vulcanicus]
MTAVRTRFAPSPTGYMHIGGMRTALFNWLWARHCGGEFILRIDDTDRARNVEEALEPILNSFRWLGLDWDEGPGVGGPHGPYFQSERGDLYREAANRLLAKGLAYRDYATSEEIAADRETAQQEKRPYLNIRRSLDLDQATLDEYAETGKPHVVRFLVPRDKTVVIDDAVRGNVEWNCGLLPDPVIQRGDGSPLYNFATVVDDAGMEITHVIRAEEHLSNTPIQALIYESLGESLPTFAHIPFVTAPGTSKKLSKRDLAKYRNNPQFKKMFERGDTVFPQLGLGDSETLNPVMVAYYEKIGYLPAAVLNALARLGWSLDDKTEILSLSEVKENFTLDRIVKNPAGLDPDKLFAFQSHWMGELPMDTKVSGCIDYLLRAGLIDSADDQMRTFVGRVIAALGDRLKLFSDILDAACFFKDEVEYDEKAFKKRIAKESVPPLLKQFQQERLSAIDESDWTTEHLEAELQSFATTHEVSPGLLIHALRIATTGQPVGPGVFDCLVLVGREKTLERIESALARVEAQA